MTVHEVTPGGEDWRDVVWRCIDWDNQAIDIGPLLAALSGSEDGGLAVSMDYQRGYSAGWAQGFEDGAGSDNA